METTGGYAPYLNGKVERPNRTIVKRVHCFLLNANRPGENWCYVTEHTADLFRVTLRSALDMSPYQAWYGDHPLFRDLQIWVCRLLVSAHGMKKSEYRADHGLFYGYAKIHSLSLA
jgi:hypothetical protein